MCCARQEQIEIEIDAKFQNASGGVLENSFKSESESFIEADVKSSTVIPPNTSGNLEHRHIHISCNMIGQLPTE